MFSLVSPSQRSEILNYALHLHSALNVFFPACSEVNCNIYCPFVFFDYYLLVIGIFSMKFGLVYIVCFSEM